MSYKVLAQKYRPQTFEDVIGQEAVTRTLANSIKSGRIANAYIFCGPRGVGKTSIARLLSKTLNCEKGADQAPCNKCSSCAEISQGNNIDVLEIDGASNRGIDEIRALRENVRFSPSKGKFKIYIIDEVHMLTTEAFNALLKTLEEPPSHVKFIFATTEAHKVLPTIMSRCQRFDFKRIPPQLVFKRLMDIASREKISVDEKAALLIARSGDGSLRDSLVILDQMVSFSGKKILPEDVLELLGMVSKDKIFELSSSLVEGASDKAALTLDELINSGKDPVFIANSLISHFRDLMILKTAGKPTTDMAFSDDEFKSLNAQLQRLSLEEILYILQNLTYCLVLMKGAMYARAPLEITLIRMSRRSSALSLPGLLEKIDNMADSGSGEAVVPLSSPAEASPGIKPAREETPEFSADTEVSEAQGAFKAGEHSWKAVMHYVKSKKMSVHTFLIPAKPVEFVDGRIVIGFSRDHVFNKDAMESEANKSVLQEAVDKVAGKPTRIEFSVLEFLGEEKDSKQMFEKDKAASEQMKPVIEKAMDVFGGRVVRDVKGAES